MSNPGGRPQPSSSKSEKASSKRTSSASSDSLALTAEVRAAPIAPLPIAALLDPPHLASGLAYPLGLPSHPGREANPQRGRAVHPQPSRIVGSQLIRGADPRPSGAVNPQSGPRLGSQFSGGADPRSSGAVNPRSGPRLGSQFSGGAHLRPSGTAHLQPSQQVGFQSSGGAGPQRSRAFHPQLSQRFDGRRRMDAFRLGLLRENMVLQQLAKTRREILSNLNTHSTRANDIEYMTQSRARILFLLNDAKGRSARFARQFETSYCPVIRDAEIPGQTPSYYGFEITQIFRNEIDPIQRLQRFEEYANRIRMAMGDITAKIDLLSEFILVIDEEMRELASAGHREIRNLSTRTTRGVPADGDAARASSGGTGVTSAAQSDASRASNTPTEAATAMLLNLRT